jgi:DNA invertase Pin-like site-specific DNA recombinase
MDAYLRVSRKGDRDGDSYRSPDLQLAEIERWAKANGVSIGRAVKEEDVSGKRPISHRGLEELIRRAERGESRGVVVHRIDRFGRDHTETIVAAKRLRDAGARLVGVADGVDSELGSGKLLLNIMSVQAEEHLDRLTSDWKSTVHAAVAQGIHISAKPPVGYIRGADRRLAPDPDSADAVRGAFEMRARGSSYQEIIDHLRAEVGRGFAKSAVSAMLRNRAYLGEARGPHGARNPTAHDALVSEELFAAVQAKARVPAVRKGALSGQARLRGLITCSACGHKLRVIGGAVDRRTGERVPAYVCVGKYASGDCPAPGGANVRLVDEYVAQRLCESAEEIAEGAASVEGRYLQAREAVRQAEDVLNQWVDDPQIAIGLGRERFQRGILARQQALDDARRVLWEIEEMQLPEDKPVVWLDGHPFIYEKWGDDFEADRLHLKRHIASVTLAKADPRRRRWQPITERVHIEWIGAS